MIQIFTEDKESHETRAARRLSGLISKQWRDLHKSEDVWIFVNARCPTKRRDLKESDTDILLLAAFDQPVPHPHDRSVQFQSLRLAIEVKNHPQHECVYEGGKIKVPYEDRRGLKNAIKQNENQCYAVKGYLSEEHGIQVAFVSRALWMRKARVENLRSRDGTTPTPKRDMVQGRGASWADFLDLVYEQEKSHAEERGTTLICGHGLLEETKAAIEVFKRGYPQHERKNAPRSFPFARHRQRPNRGISAAHAKKPRSSFLRLASAPFLALGALLRGANQAADAVFASFRALLDFARYLARTVVRLAGALLLLLAIALAAAVALGQTSALEDALPPSIQDFDPEAFVEGISGGASQTAASPGRPANASGGSPASAGKPAPRTLPVAEARLKAFFDAGAAGSQQSTAAQCRRRALSSLYEAVEEQSRQGSAEEIHRETVCPRYRVIVSWAPSFTVKLLERDRQQRDRFGNPKIVYSKTYRAP